MRAHGRVSSDAVAVSQHKRGWRYALVLFALCVAVATIALLSGTAVPAAQAAGTGSISGTVTAGDIGTPSFSSMVQLTRYLGGQRWQYAGYTYTAPSLGTYQFSGLVAGTYIVDFGGDYSQYLWQYYDGQIDWNSATRITVAVGQARTGIDANLVPASHITGKVIDADGLGISGISVTAQAYINGRWGWSNSGSTNGDGVYTISPMPAGVYRLVVRDYSGRYLPKTYFSDLGSAIAVGTAETVQAADVTLSPAGHITGTVFGDNGVPLSSTDIRAYRLIGSRWKYVRSAYSSFNGTYDLSGLTTGSYRLEFREWMSDYLAQFYDGKATLASADSVAVTTGQVTSGVDVTLVHGGKIQGTVTSSVDGQPVSRAIVYAYRPGRRGGWDSVGSVRAGSDGTYSIGHLGTGNYRVVFVDKSGWYLRQCYKNKTTRDAAEDVAVTAGELTSSIDAVLVPASRIRGTVTDLKGHPVSRVDVSAYRQGPGGGWNRADWARTRSDGTYVLGDLAAGDYRIKFQQPRWAQDFAPQFYSGQDAIAAARDVHVDEGGTATGIDAALVPLGHVTGKVTDTQGKSIGGVDVIAYRWDHSGGWQYVRDTSTSAVSGSYDLHGLNAGIYRVWFHSGGHQFLEQYYNDRSSLDAADDINVSLNTTTPGIDATMAPFAHVRGTVTGDGGATLSGIWVTAYRPDGSGGWKYVSDTTTSATDGSYDLSGLSTGGYRLRFRDDSGTYLTECYDNKATLDEASPVHADSGQTTGGVDARLALAGHIRGAVTDAAGTGLADIWVTAYGDDGSGGWKYIEDVTTAATDGSYDLAGLPTGDYRIRFTDRSKVHAQQYFSDRPTLAAADGVSVVAGQTTPDVNATLAPAAHITGTVSPPGGVSPTRILVTAYQDDGSGGWQYAGDTSTNASNGAYDLGGLAAGSYRLRFSDRSRMYAPQFYDGKLTIGTAHDVGVATGATTSDVDASLVLGSHITGAVKNADGGAVGDIWVAAYQQDGTSAWQYIEDVTTSATDGSYDLKGLAAGIYRVRFSDHSGTYAPQCYDGATTIATAGDIDVDADSTTSGINATLAAAGHVSGAVTDSEGRHLAGVKVTAYQSDDAGGWQYIADATTDAGSGAYDLKGLATGACRLKFSTDSGAYLTQFYDGQGTIAAADDIQVQDGQTTPGLDAVMWSATDSVMTAFKFGALTPTVAGTVDQSAHAIALAVPFGTNVTALVASFTSSGSAVKVGDVAQVSGVTPNDFTHPVIYNVAIADGSSQDYTVTVTVLPDTTAPKTTASPDDHTWRSGPVTVQFTAADTESGVDYTEYSLDNGANWHRDSSVSVSDVGPTTILYRSADVSGNIEAAKAVVAHVANTETGSNQTIELPAGDLPASVALTFDTVSAPGFTSVIESAADPGPAPALFEAAEQSFYKIETTAVYDGPITVSFPYDATGLTLEQQQTLRIMHLVGTEWVDATTSVDTTAHILYGSVTHFSWFSVAVDTKPPTTVATASPSGWTNGQVSLTLRADDAGGSGVTATYYRVGSGSPQSYSGPIVAADATPVSFWSTDQAGNVEATNTLTPKIDKMTPVTAAVSKSGWQKGSAEVDFSATDAGDSGVERTEYWTNDGALWTRSDVATITSEGKTTVTYHSLDRAGNSETPKSVDVYVDASAPSATVAASPASWTTGSVVVSLSATDTLSGIDPNAVTCSVDGAAPQALKWTATGVSVTVSAAGARAVSFTVKDMVGNATTVETHSLIDRTAPNATTSVTPTGWTNAAAVSVGLAAADVESGVNTASATYSVDDAAAEPLPWGNSVVVSSTGTHKVTFTVADKVGNKATVSATVAIDRTAPSTSVNYHGAWATKPVALQFTASDSGGSGVDHTESSIDAGRTWTPGSTVTVALEGQTDVLYRSADKAGNVETAHSITVKIDRSAPVITLTCPAEGAVYTEFDPAAVVQWSATDDYSGVATSGATVASGQLLDMTPGRHTFTVRATDACGNTTSIDHTYTVRDVGLNLFPAAGATLPLGDVIVGQTVAEVVTATNTGEVPLWISAATAPAAPASFTVSGSGVLVNPGQTVDLTVHFAPPVTGALTSALHVEAGDAANHVAYPLGLADIALIGRGVSAELPPDQVAQKLLLDYNAAIADGTLVGIGPGNSAAGRVKALRNMIEAAGDYISRRDYVNARRQLNDAIAHCDGLSTPPEFVSGPARQHVYDEATALLRSIGG